MVQVPAQLHQPRPKRNWQVHRENGTPQLYPGFFPTRPHLSLLRNEVDGDKFRVQVSFVTPPHPSNPYNIPHSSLECLILSWLRLKQDRTLFTFNVLSENCS